MTESSVEDEDQSRSSDGQQKADAEDTSRDGEIEYESKPLSEYESYEEYIDNEMLEHPAMKTEPPSGRKWTLLRYLVRFLFILLSIGVVGLIGYVGYQMLLYLFEFSLQYLEPGMLIIPVLS